MTSWPENFIFPKTIGSYGLDQLDMKTLSSFICVLLSPLEIRKQTKRLTHTTNSSANFAVTFMPVLVPRHEPLLLYHRSIKNHRAPFSSIKWPTPWPTPWQTRSRRNNRRLPLEQRQPWKLQHVAVDRVCHTGPCMPHKPSEQWAILHCPFSTQRIREVTVTLGVNPMHATRGEATKQRIKRLSKVMKARQYESGGGGWKDEDWIECRGCCFDACACGWGNENFL